ncbi:MAG: hypothetical protein ACW964_12545 [Candidatus Hodarchaeales archaeon]|jgi:hypothetical protein
MALVTLDSDDLFLVTMESLILIGLVITLILALRIRSRYPNLTSIGWLEICVGLLGVALHAVFDVLDTFKWSIEDMSDLLNVFDGSTFVLGLILVGIGILRVANYGAKAWEM